MAFAAPVRAVLASFLGLLTSLPPGAVCAIPSDGSTLFTDRGVSPLAGETRAAASAQPDLFTGAAVTAIALELPPGTGGLTPSLALRYSSADRGKSWVGTGWMLSLPAIVRSLERGVPRYDDGIDVFELEGEKLVPESDTPVLPRRHHARRERFERVVHETDGSWTVTAPDGTKRRFGLSSESRIEAPGSGFVFAWLLAEEEDVHGNAVVFRYDRTDAGTAYPSEVRYTMRRSQAGELTSLDSDPSRDRLVRFVLEPRPDVSTSHATGFERVLAHRLRAVNVTIGNERLRCWELSYVQSPDSADSLLVSVSLFGNDAACDGTGAPSPPFVTRMSYRTNAGADPPLTGWDGPVPFAWPAGLSLVDANGEDRGVRLADVDGDGRPDLVKAYAIPATGQSVDGFARSSDSGIHRNTGEGFETAASSSLALPEIAGQIGAMTTSFARDHAGHGVATGLAALDLDGDGRTDLAGGVRWLDYATGSTATYGIGGLHHGTGLGFEAVGDYGELLDDDRWALARYGLIDFSWSWNGSGWYGSFASGALAGPARFADLTGDGLPELIVRSTEIHTRWSGIAPPFHPGSRSCTFSLSSYHFLNEGGLRFLRGATSDFPVTSDLCGTSASLRLSAAFQPCDPFEPSCQRRLIHDEARAQRYLGDGSYAHWYVHWELGNEEIDLDSDGLADAVSAAYDVVLGSESLAASINAGGGAFLDAPAWRLPVHLYEIDATFARDLGVRLADVNGDGRVDVVQAAQSAAHRTWLNRGAPGGGSGDGPWMASTAWTLPAALAFASATGQDLGLRLVDLDGDGMTDLVRSIGGADEVYRNRGRIPDLLETLTTPLGARTSWSYTPSTAFDHTGNLAAPFEPRVSDGLPHLPQVLPLVTAIEVVAGAEGPSLTTYAYEGGVFDATTRELRGFRRVTATRTDGRSTVTHFHQDEARTGLVERMDVFSPGAEGRRLRSLELGYTADGDGPPFVNLLERRIETDYDDPASPRRMASTFRYDEFGNVTERIDYGEVSAGADGAITDLVAGDTRATEVAYASASGDPEPYLVNRVRRQRVRQGLPGTGAVLRETVYFYDGDTTASAPPTRGLVTRRIDVRSPGTSEGPATTYGYDAYGNLVWVRDPRANAGQGGGTTLYGVDPRWHAFRTSVTNALGHVTALSTSTPAGCAAYPAGAGIVQQERGPSVAAGEVGLRRCLDAFGRVVRERAPLDLAESRWVYDDTSGASRIERYDRTSEGERASVSWLDGLGRPVATRTSGPEERAVVTARSYDALGRLASETAPHFDADSAPVTQTDYDVLDRPVRIALPGTGRVSTVAHGRARISITNASGTTQTRVFDPFGNVVEVAEGAGGSEVTTYAWDALDHLLEVRDATGNRMLVEYDTLGRRTSLSDPDTGVTHFGAYDDDGNLLSRSDALGTTTWTYDALGRPLSRSAGASVVTFTYDTATRGTGLLASRSDDAGTLRIWSYDALGRVTADSQDVAGTTLFFATSFDPLGAVASRTYPGGRSLAFDRDGAGYLTAIRTTGISAASVATDIAWDARGRLAAWTGANGVESRSAFEPETGRLSAVSVRQGSTLLEDLSYGFDASDRVVSIEDRRSGGLANRSFVHDAQGRLIEASGPYGAGLAPATLHYAYDIAGNLVCKDATSASGCAGGIAMVYPATTGSHPAHAPATVGGLAATYDAIGDLTALGTRSYAYDALGRLTSVADAGVMRSANLYDALGRRAEWIDRSGSRPVTQRFVRPDFTWDATRGLGRIEVELAGRPIATLVGAFDPQTASSTPLAVGPPRTRGVIVLTAALPPLLGATALLGWLAVLRRRRVSWGRPALAGVTALAFHLFAIRPALSLPDGDLNGDGSLDAADVLVAGRIATGERSASATDLDHGDVAPLESAPQTPSRVDAGDLVLLWRAIRGEDVDGDGLDTAAELGGGASPFRADTDRDGLADGAERALGTAPGLEDSDGDGLGDGAEVAAGSDPLTRDTDGDGVDDAVDPAPRSGVVFRHGDHLGSSVLVTKASGTGEALVVSRAVYAPYGGALGAVPPERGFGGRQRDTATGLYDYGARWYDPATGRFLQPDSVVPNPLRPATLNRYAYAEGGPVDHVDPSGHASISFHVFAGTLGPSGFTGAGLDVAFSFGAGGFALSADPWLSVQGTQIRLAKQSPGAMGFQSILSSQLPDFGAATPKAAMQSAAGATAAFAAGDPPYDLPGISVGKLEVGDVLLTGDGGLAVGLRFSGADRWGEWRYGHAAMVLERTGERVQVLSAGEQGMYVAWNDDANVGDRSWAVIRPRNLDPVALKAFVAQIPLGRGAVGSPDAYLANHGGNVCSSTVARALEASSDVRIERTAGNLVTPGALRAAGWTVGKVFIPAWTPSAGPW